MVNIWLITPPDPTPSSISPWPQRSWRRTWSLFKPWVVQNHLRSRRLEDQARHEISVTSAQINISSTRMVDFSWNPMEFTMFLFTHMSLSLKPHPLPWNHHKSSKKKPTIPHFFPIKMEKKRKWPLIWDDFSHLQKSPENPPKITSIFSPFFPHLWQISSAICA